MQSERWDGWLQLGDLMDLSIISSHSAGKLRELECGRILAEYQVADDILSRHATILRKNNPNARMVYLSGNHEHRQLGRYLDLHPELTGMIEIPHWLKLEQRKIEWIDSWGAGKLFQLGRAWFHHGLYTSQNAAKRMVECFNRNIFFGHCHTYQVHSIHGYRAEDVLIGASLGCLCKIPQKYLHGAPTRWCHMVTVFHVEPSTGQFWFNPIQIREGKLCYDGKLFR
jgi:hypothetical protein